MARRAPRQSSLTGGEGILDRLIEKVSPERALKRRQARMVLAATTGGSNYGSYIAARRDRAATMTWGTNQVSGNNALLPDLPALRSRSADLYRNVAVARGAVSTMVSNVVGTGLQARPRIDREYLGLSEEQANDLQKQFRREWDLWAYSAECDLSRSLTFDGLQTVALRATLIDGDVFAAKRYVERPGSPYGLKIQLIEGARVLNPNRTADSATLRAGVEIDANGAPIAYHVASRHPDEFMTGNEPLAWSRVPVFGEQSGMRQILHLFQPSGVGVMRGEPFLAPAMEPLKQLGKYTEAELMAAVINSCFAVVTKTTSGEGIDMNPSGETDVKGDEIVLGAPGTMVDLGENESLEGFTPGRPTAAFDPFMQAILRQIGMALELPYEVLVKHFQSSYSAARAALLDATRLFRNRRDWLAWSFCQPCYEAVLIEAVARGRISAPGFFGDAAVMQAWTGCDWIGPTPGQIDPVKEVEANTMAVEQGFKTREQATIELTGGDWSANHEVRVREEKMRRDGETVLPAPPPPPMPPQGRTFPSDAPTKPDDDKEEAA